MSPPSPESPFDSVARGYDCNFSETELGREMRAQVWREIEGVFSAGDRILEIGCGTGEDSLWLAQRGVRVLATDASAAMLEVTREKVDGAGVGSMVATRRLDLADLDEDGGALDGPFDGALSNFGPLNCIADRTPVARALAGLIRPGGTVVTVLMGSFCPWEILWHMAHGELATATRRFRKGRPAHLGNGVTIPVWYPTPARVRREFAHGFRPSSLLAIGCFLPPPDLAHLAQTRPAMIRRLAGWEARWQRLFPFTWCGDHFLQSFVRQPTLRSGARDFTP